MASNRRRIARRLPDIRDGRPVYDYGIFEARSYGSGRELVAIIEDCTFADAQEFLNAPPTVGGHSVKGFKKLKAAS